MFAAMDRAIDALESSAGRSAQEQQHRDEMRSVLLALIDISDAVQALASHLREGPGQAVPERTVTLLEKMIAGHLATAGLEKLPALGLEADLAAHEIIGTRNDVETADHTVVAEIRPGYRWRGRVLRPAQVIVNISETPANT